MPPKKEEKDAKENEIVPAAPTNTQSETDDPQILVVRRYYGNYCPPSENRIKEL